MENKQQTTLDGILEIVTFVKDNAVTKREFDEGMEGINTRFGKVEARLDTIESAMVTKDYLDEKLGDVKGDIIVEVRHEDKKLTALIEVLRSRNVISTDEAKNILGMKPFPQLSIS